MVSLIFGFSQKQKPIKIPEKIGYAEIIVENKPKLRNSQSLPNMELKKQTIGNKILEKLCIYFYLKHSLEIYPKSTESIS